MEFPTLPWKSMGGIKPAGYSKPQNSGNGLNDLLNLAVALLGADSSVKGHRLPACTAELPEKSVKDTLKS